MASLLFMPNVNFSQISNLIFGPIVHLKAILISVHKTTPEHPNQIKVKPCYFQPVFDPSNSPICSHYLKKTLIFAFCATSLTSNEHLIIRGVQRLRNARKTANTGYFEYLSHLAIIIYPQTTHFYLISALLLALHTWSGKILHSHPTEPFRDFIYHHKNDLRPKPKFFPAHFSNSIFRSGAAPAAGRGDLGCGAKQSRGIFAE